MNTTGISVIIPNYNGENLLPAILPPLLIALENTRQPFEIFVVDDCSTDKSVQYLKDHYPMVKILQNDINSGFSVTANKGFYAAQYPYVFLLNSDVKLEADFFLPLFKYFDDKKTFGVMGRIIGWDDDVIQDTAKYPSFHGVKIKTTGNYLPESLTGNERLYSMYLSGANAFLEREKLLQLGGFNEMFSPFYVEDYELSLRAWRLGYTCYYEHQAICRHQVSTSIKSKSSKNFINTVYYRNKLFLHAIHLEKQTLFLWYMQLVLEAILAGLTGKFYFYKSLRLFFSNLKKVKQAKAKIQLLAAETHNLRSVRAVADTILNSLEGKKIRRF